MKIMYVVLGGTCTNSLLGVSLLTDVVVNTVGVCQICSFVLSLCLYHCII